MAQNDLELASFGRGAYQSLPASPLPASASLFQEVGSCKPGGRGISGTRSKFTYSTTSVSECCKKLNPPAATLGGRLDGDIDAVIKLYNSIPGSRLVLERDTGITGDSEPGGDRQGRFGRRRGGVGFTDDKPTDSPDAEAWTDPAAPNDGCTKTRGTISSCARTSTGSSGRPTAPIWTRLGSVPLAPGPKDESDTLRTFLGILTHEMGHALRACPPARRLRNHGAGLRDMVPWSE